MARLQIHPMRGPGTGWSLLELIVTVAVLGILVAIALPGFQRTLNGLRASSARQVLSSHLAMARLAAIQRSEHIVVCPSHDGRTCSDDRRGWAHGWIIQRAGRDGAPLAGQDAPLYQHRLRYPPNFSIRASEGRSRIHYQPNGRAWGTNLTLQVCMDADLLAEVVVNNSGRVRSERLHRRGGCGP